MNARKHLKAAERLLKTAETWQRESDDVNASTCAQLAEVHVSIAMEKRRAAKSKPIVGAYEEDSIESVVDEDERYWPVDKHPHDSADAADETDWTIGEASTQMLAWLTAAAESHPYWNVSMLSGHNSIEAIVDSTETVDAIAEALGVEVTERPYGTSGTTLVAEGAMRGWQMSAFITRRAPKSEPEPAPEPVEPVEDAASETPADEAAHQLQTVIAGPAGDCGVECNCGVGFYGFDTVSEAEELLDRHIADESAPKDAEDTARPSLIEIRNWALLTHPEQWAKWDAGQKATLAVEIRKPGQTRPWGEIFDGIAAQDPADREDILTDEAAAVADALSADVDLHPAVADGGGLA